MANARISRLALRYSLITQELHQRLWRNLGLERILSIACLARGAAMIQDVFSALWFITLLLVVYGIATGNLCLWRRDD
jgi:hypothetical protein